MADTTPERLVAALLAAGWVENGRAGPCVRMRFADHKPTVLVPTDSTVHAFDSWMSSALRELRQMAELGNAADRALTEATCSCGGKRWVDDEGWQPEEWAMAVKPVREPGAGLIPCGSCNHGGWNVPVGAAE